MDMRQCSSFLLVPCDAVQDAMNLAHNKHLLQTHILLQTSVVKRLQSMKLVVVIFPKDGALTSIAVSSAVPTASTTTGRSKVVA